MLRFWSVQSLPNRQRLKNRKLFLVCALCTPEIHIALGAIAADWRKDTFLPQKRD